MFKEKKKAFTLIELMVFVIISTIFAIFALSILNNFLKARQSAAKLDDLQSTVSLVFNQLIQDIHWSDQQLIETNGALSKLTLVTKDQIQVYEVSNGQLLLNGLPITPEDVKIIFFKINNLAVSSDRLPCLKVEIGLEHAKLIPSRVILEDSMIISFRIKKLNLEEDY